MMPQNKKRLFCSQKEQYDKKSVFFRITSYLVSTSLILTPVPSFAQGIVSDTTAATANQAQVRLSRNGVVIVDIVKPVAGLSHNKFQDFNVNTNGAVLNNSKDLVSQSRLAAAIAGNANLRNSAAANVILSEVTSRNKSDLKGYLEVHGAAAEVIVANPNGITCNGCGFYNTPRATLTTGSVNTSDGGINRIKVERGHVKFGGQGADVRNVEVFDILSRSVDFDGIVKGNVVRVLSGVNTIDYTGKGADVSYAVVEGDGTGAELAISSSALGGVYGNRVSIISSERGSGVNMMGSMASGVNGLKLAANGQLSFGQVSSQGDLELIAKSNIGQGSSDIHGIKGKNVAAVGTVTANSDGNVSLESANAGTDVVLDSRNDIAVKTISANRNVVLQSTGGVLGNQYVDNTDAMPSLNGELNIFARGNIKVTTGLLLMDHLAAVGNIDVTADTVKVAKLDSDRDINVSGLSNVNLGQANSVGNIDISSKGSVGGLDDQTGVRSFAGANVSIKADKNIDASSLAAKANVAVDAKESINLNQVLSQSNVSVVGGSVNVVDLEAKGTTSLIARQGDLTVDNVDSEGHAVLQALAGNVNYDQVVAGAGLSVVANSGSILVKEEAKSALLSAMGNLDLEAESVESVNKRSSILSDGKIIAEIGDGGISDVNEMASAGSIDLNTTGELAASHISSLTDVKVKAKAVSVDLIEAQGGDLDITATQGDLKSVTLSAKGELNAIAHKLVDLGTVFAEGNITLVGQVHKIGTALAGVDFSASNTASSTRFKSGAKDIKVTAVDEKEGLANAGEILGGNYVATGNVILSSENDLAYDSSMSGQNISVESTQGDVKIGNTISKGNLIVNTSKTAEFGGEILNSSETRVIDVAGTLAITANEVKLAESNYTFGGFNIDAQNNIDIESATLKAKANVDRNIAGNISFKGSAITTNADTVLDADGHISLATTENYTNDGVLIAKDQIHITSDGSIANNNEITAGKSIVLGKLSGDTYARNIKVTNQGAKGITSQNGDVMIFTEKLDSSSSITSVTANVVADAGDVLDAGNIDAGGNIYLQVDENINVTGAISAGQGAVIFSNSLVNNNNITTSSGDIVIAKGVINGQILLSTDVSNNGLIQSDDSSVIIRADTLGNKGSLLAQSGDMFLTAGNLTNSGAISSGDLSITVDDSYTQTSGNVHADKTLSILSNQGSINLIGTASGWTAGSQSVNVVRPTLTGGDIKLQALEGITVKVAHLDAKGNSQEGLFGNLQLLTEGKIDVGAVQLSDSKDFETVNSEQLSKITELLFWEKTTDQKTTKTWTDVYYKSVGSSLQATNDISLQSNEGLHITASDVTSGNGQVYRAESITLDANYHKEGTEVINRVVNQKVVETTCVLGGLAGCSSKTISKTADNLINNTAASRVSNISGAQSALKHRIDISLTMQNAAIKAQASESVTSANDKMNVVVTAQQTSVGQVTEGAIATDTAFSMSQSLSAKNTDVAVSTTDVSGVNENGAALSGIADVSTGPAQYIPQENRNEFTDERKHVVNSLDEIGYDGIAKNVNQNEQMALATTQRHVNALSNKTTVVGGLDNSVNTPKSMAISSSSPTANNNGVQYSPIQTEAIATSSVQSLTQNGNIVMMSNGDISGQGTKINTVAEINLSSANGNVKFTPIKISSSTIDFDSSTSQSSQSFGLITLGRTTTKRTRTITEANSYEKSSLLGVQGVTISANNGQIDLVGTQILSPSGSVSLAANKVNITSVKGDARTMTHSETTGLDYGKTEHNETNLELSVGSLLSAGDSIRVSGRDGVDIHSSNLQADNDISIFAGYDQNGDLINNNASVNLTADVNRITSTSSSDERGTFVGSTDKWLSLVGSNSKSTNSKFDSGIGVSIASGRNTVINSANDIFAEAASISAKNDISLTAKGDITLTAVKESNWTETKSASSSLGLGNVDTDLETGELSIQAGLQFENQKTSVTGIGYKGSVLDAGNNASLIAENDINIIGSDLVSKNDLDLAAGGSITIKETIAKIHTAVESSSGFIGSKLTLSSPVTKAAGAVYKNAKGIQPALSNANKALNDVDDSLSTIRAVAKITDVGTGVLDFRDNLKKLEASIKPYTKFDKLAKIEKDYLPILNVGLDFGVNVKGTASNENISIVKGSSLAPTNGDINVVSGKDFTLSASTLESSKDINIKAGGNINLAAAYNTYDLSTTTNVFDARVGVAGGVNANLNPSLASVYFSVSLNNANASVDNKTAVVSQIMAKNKINLEAGNDFNSIGGQVNGNEVALIVGDNINLRSAINTVYNDSNSSEIGVSGNVGLGPKVAATSLSLKLKGDLKNGENSSLTNTLARINGNKSVTIQSGGDTLLIGAVVTGGDINANVGGDLSIESVQDIASSSAFGLSGSVGGTISATPSVKWDIAIDGANASSAWVNEQSGIIGNGSVIVDVAGNTDLVGGIINANSGDLKLMTGSLSYSDIKDHNKSDKALFKAGFTLGFDRAKSLRENISETNLDLGFKHIDKEQLTKATIGSGMIEIAGNVGQTAGLNRDASNSQEITRDINIDALDLFGNLETIVDGRQRLNKEVAAQNKKK
tara:strand:- start:1592 stop:9310 length:7719 start_codon:yes stop_codon:yes gene_type:complete